MKAKAGIAKYQVRRLHRQNSRMSTWLLLLLLLFHHFFLFIIYTLGSKDPEGSKLSKRIKTIPLVARAPSLVESCHTTWLHCIAAQWLTASETDRQTVTPPGT